MKKNVTITPKRSFIYIPVETYQAYRALVVKYNKTNGEKLTMVRAMTEALDFFSETALLPREYKRFDTQKKLSSVEENVLKTKNQTIGFLRNFEKELLGKLLISDSSISVNIQKEFNISIEDILIYLYKKNKIIDDKIQILLWFFLKFFENSELPEEDIKSIFEEYKKRLKSIGTSKTRP